MQFCGEAMSGRFREANILLSNGPKIVGSRHLYFPSVLWLKPQTMLSFS
jgi:hypothetical protein